MALVGAAAGCLEADASAVAAWAKQVGCCCDCGLAMLAGVRLAGARAAVGLPLAGACAAAGEANHALVMMQ